MSYLLLLLAGIIAYLFSTISGGGGALTLLPIVGFYLHPSAVAPVVNLGNMIGRPARIILFKEHINWSVIKYYVPFACLGSMVGALIFVRISSQWMTIILGSFLIVLGLQFILSKKEKTFKVKQWYFSPLGFIVSFISTIFGATGPIMNTFYLNYGLKKEELIATKTVNSFLVGIVQISSYGFLGALNWELAKYGLVIGIGAIIGNIIGKKFLQKMSSKTFKLLVVLVMITSGAIMLAGQL